MQKIARLAFSKAIQIIDRFYVQNLATEALQNLRINFRWSALDAENLAKKNLFFLFRLTKLYA